MGNFLLPGVVIMRIWGAGGGGSGRVLLGDMSKNKEI